MSEERITKLEVNFARTDERMEHFSSELAEVKVIVKELRPLVVSMARLESGLARVEDRVANHKVSANGTAKRLEGAKEQLVSTRISVAKLMVITGTGGGVLGGGVVFGLIELFKFLAT